MTPINFVLILVNTLILVSGQFLWKYGMMKSGQSFSSLLGILKLLLSPYILTGLILYGAATVLWLFILSKVSLSVAYPIQSLAYVFALFGAYFLFGETLTSWKIAGVLLIVAGVAMISVHSGR